MPGPATPGSLGSRDMWDCCCKARAVGGLEGEPQGAEQAGFCPALGEKALERTLMSGFLYCARWVSVSTEVAPQLGEEGLEITVQGFGQALGKDVVIGWCGEGGWPMCPHLLGGTQLSRRPATPRSPAPSVPCAQPPPRLPHLHITSSERPLPAPGHPPAAPPHAGTPGGPCRHVPW